MILMMLINLSHYVIAQNGSEQVPTTETRAQGTQTEAVLCKTLSAMHQKRIDSHTVFETFKVKWRWLSKNVSLSAGLHWL